MTFIRGNNEYLLSLQIVSSDDDGFTWEIVVTEHRDGRTIQSKELSSSSFDTNEEVEADGKNEMFKMLTRRVLD